MLSQFHHTGKLSGRFKPDLSKVQNLTGSLIQLAHSGQVFDLQTPIIEFANALEVHTAQAFSNPLVEAVELPLDRAKRGSEVVGISQDDPIEGSNSLLTEIMGAGGHFADFVFEFLH